MNRMKGLKDIKNINTITITINRKKNMKNEKGRYYSF